MVRNFFRAFLPFTAIFGLPILLQSIALSPFVAAVIWIASIVAALMISRRDPPHQYAHLAQSDQSQGHLRQGVTHSRASVLQSASARYAQSSQAPSAAALTTAISRYRSHTEIDVAERWKQRSMKFYTTPLKGPSLAERSGGILYWSQSTVNYEGPVIAGLLRSTTVFQIEHISGTGGSWPNTCQAGPNTASDHSPIGDPYITCEIRVILYPGELPHPYAFDAHITNDSRAASPRRVAMMPQAIDPACAQRWSTENRAWLHSCLNTLFRSLPLEFDFSISRHTDLVLDIVIVFEESTGMITWASGWPSQERLYRCVKSLFPDAIFEYSPPWLGRQHLDIFVPSRKLAIEYQGQQHFRPVSKFGGEQKFFDTYERDLRKRRLCQANGVILVEWPYTDKIDTEAVRARLREAGVPRVPQEG